MANLPLPMAFADLSFPVRGTDLSPGFGAQPPLTTPSAVNVRAWEPVTGRARGGTRPGLLRFVAGQLPTGAKVQHLNVVVDPSADALLVNLDYPGPDAVDDPSSAGPPSSWPAQNTDPVTGLPLQSRNPGRLIRPGGNGYPSNKNKKATARLSVTANDQTKTQGDTFAFAGTEFTTSPLTVGGSVSSAALASAGAASGAEPGTYPISVANAVGTGLANYRITYVPGTMTVNPAGIARVQLAQRDFDFTIGVFPATFSSDVTAGHLVVVAVSLNTYGPLGGGASPDPTVAVTDTLGNVYTQAGGYQNDTFLINVTDEVRVKAGVWYAVSAFTGANAVTATPSDMTTTQCSAFAVEYSGTAASPFDGAGGHTDAATVTVTTGTIGVSQPGDVMLGVFSTSIQFPGAGVVIVAGNFGTLGEILPANASGPVSGTNALPGGDYVARGASFKKA